MNTKVIKLDLNKRLYDKIIAKQDDTGSRFLLFQLFDGALPFNLANRSVRVYGVKPDGTTIFNDLTITHSVTGFCLLELTNQMLAVAGIVKLELMITEEDKKLTTIPFELEVIKKINSNAAVESSNEFSSLLNALKEIDQWNREFADKSGKLEELYTPRLNELDEQLDTIENTKSFSNNELYNDFLNVNSLNKVESGQSVGIYNNGLNEYGYKLENGYLVHGVSAGNNAASYFECELKNKVNRIGAIINFPTENCGRVALCSFKESIVKQHKPIPPAGIHVIFGTNIVRITRWGYPEVVIKQFSYSFPIGEDIYIECIRHGNNITLILPNDKITETFSYEDVEENTSNFATWELYEGSSGVMCVKIKKIWADSDKKGDYCKFFTKDEILNKYPANKSYNYFGTESNTVSIQTSKTTIYTMPVKVPKSKKAFVSVTYYGKVDTGIMFLGVSVAGNLAYGFEMNVGNGSREGVNTITGIINFPESFTTDFDTELRFEGRMYGGAGSIVIDSTTQKRLVMTMIPIQL